jgi:hypothetical protein
MLTSSLEDADRKKARELGAHGFFIEPPTLAKLTYIPKTSKTFQLREMS